ncbi:MAG: hypothetical protein NC399_07390 [Muribaculum sp.]|nr:hypothetical protein [Muribaculum sp.]
MESTEIDDKKRRLWREIWVKKLALAYQTGWEYMPGSPEAGSVLTDSFLDMMQENQKRYDEIWERHKQKFLSVMPPQEREARKLKTALSVRASGGSDGECLARGTECYMIPEQGSLLRFALQEDLRLTAARLRYAVYQKGLCAWLTYDGGTAKDSKDFPILLSQAVGEELCHPVFRWYFPNLCNGKDGVAYVLEWEPGEDLPDLDDRILPGVWQISGGADAYLLEWEQSEGQCRLSGSTPAFAGYLGDVRYEIRLDIPAGEEMDPVWLEILSREFSLREAGECREAQLCLTAAGACGGERLLPFTDAPEAGMCCYLACDGVLAGEGGEVSLRFTERCDIEERLPPETPKEYAKLYRKYPWLKPQEAVEEWSVRETCWEYFDGNFWKKLPENAASAAGEGKAVGEKEAAGEGEAVREQETTGEKAAGEGKVVGEKAAAGEKETAGEGEAVGEQETAGEEKTVGEQETAGEKEAAGEGKSEAGERIYRWRLPQDMRPCSVEGEEHFYIRLRAVKADNAYAAYYRKKIPVWEGLRFASAERRVLPKERIVADRSAGQTGNYLGFDREVTGDNRWYAGSESFHFTPDQMIGRKVLFGREAFWVRLEAGDPMAFPVFYPNYVEILGLPETGEGDLDSRLPAGTVFHVETPKTGILDAISVCDARYGGRGTALWEEEQWRESYPAVFGRVMSVMDLEILLQKSYPFVRIYDCQYKEEARELAVILERQGDSEKEEGMAVQLQTLLPEIGEWFEEMLHHMGPLHLGGCHVSCLEREVAECGEKEAADGEVVG